MHGFAAASASHASAHRSTPPLWPLKGPEDLRALELVAEITGQAHEWVVPRGTAD
jgi:hypothetical protein